MSVNPIDSIDRKVLDSAADEVRRRDLPDTPFHPLLQGRIPETAPALSVGPAGAVELRHIAGLADSVSRHTPQIGDMPPRPNTLRARLGAVLVAMVRRMLFWYTEQIRSFQGRVCDAAREQITLFQRIVGEQQRHSATLGELADGIAQAQSDQRWNMLAEQDARLKDLELSLNLRISELEHKQDRLDQENCSRISELERKQDLLNQGSEDLRSEAQELRERVDAAGIPNWAAILRTQQETGARIAALEAHITALELAISSEVTATKPVLSRRRGAEWKLSLDTLFTEHASAFRGDPAEIRSRLSVYAPYAKSVFDCTGQAPAIDLGCGRGEWLDILRESGISARGVDTNETLVTSCRHRGLDVTHGDLIEFLQSLPSESHAIVTAFHVVEHLSFADLLEVLDQTRRVLKCGGMAIFETPNPRNLLTSARNFYLDPTHRHPLPAELLTFLITARGLHHQESLSLQPYPETTRLPESDDPAARFINEHFYGPQDYSVIARRS